MNEPANKHCRTISFQDGDMEVDLLTRRRCPIDPEHDWGYEGAPGPNGGTRGVARVLGQEGCKPLLSAPAPDSYPATLR